VIDPRPLAEILRQWTTFHPEFAFLPRKFKIAISGTREDRAVTWFHDIGLHLQQQDGEDRLPRHRRRRPRPHADSRPGRPRIPALAAHPDLLRSHPARL
jgi:hypothetical protein